MQHSTATPNTRERRSCVMDRLEGFWCELPGETFRQERYDRLAVQYGTFGLNSRVGARFLQKHQDLL